MRKMTQSQSVKQERTAVRCTYMNSIMCSIIRSVHDLAWFQLLIVGSESECASAHVLVFCWFWIRCRILLLVFSLFFFFFFFSSRRRHTRSDRDWSSDVCSSD